MIESVQSHQAKLQQTYHHDCIKNTSSILRKKDPRRQSNRCHRNNASHYGGQNIQCQIENEGTIQGKGHDNDSHDVTATEYETELYEAHVCEYGDAQVWGKVKAIVQDARLDIYWQGKVTMQNIARE